MATISVVIPDDLLATHERFRTENGDGWLDAYTTEKLKELAQRHEDADMRTLYVGTPIDARVQAIARAKANLVVTNVPA